MPDCKKCRTKRVGRAQSVPTYIAQTVSKDEATALVQFREGFSLDYAGKKRTFHATSRVRLPYSIVFSLIRHERAPIFFVSKVERQQFDKAYGINGY